LLLVFSGGQAALSPIIQKTKQNTSGIDVFLRCGEFNPREMDRMMGGLVGTVREGLRHLRVDTEEQR
jgi:hypothetical protein